MLSGAQYLACHGPIGAHEPTWIAPTEFDRLMQTGRYLTMLDLSSYASGWRWLYLRAVRAGVFPAITDGVRTAIDLRMCDRLGEAMIRQRLGA